MSSWYFVFDGRFLFAKLIAATIMGRSVSCSESDIDAAVRPAGMRTRPAWDMRTSFGDPKCEPPMASGELLRSGGFDQPKLGQRSHAVIEADLLHDLTAENLQHCGASEVHFAAGRSGKSADQKVVKS